MILPCESVFSTNALVLKYTCSVRLLLGRFGFPTMFGREFVGDCGLGSSTTFIGVPERIVRMLLICQPPNASSIGRLQVLKNRCPCPMGRRYSPLNTMLWRTSSSDDAHSARRFRGSWGRSLFCPASNGAAPLSRLCEYV